MSTAFQSQHGLIIIPAEVEGPTGQVVLRVALDTGATTTLISTALLVAVGYDPSLAPTRVQVTTGSGVEYLPLIPLQRLRALDQDRIGLSVLGHTLPPSANIDGVIGLDFLRGQNLIIDFRAGLVSLS